MKKEVDTLTEQSVREKIAITLISKLDHITMDDIQMLPAVVDFIVTGREDFFYEFREFLSMKDAENRKKKMERLTAQYEEAIEHNKKVKDEYSEHLKNFRKYIEDSFSDIDELFAKKEFVEIHDNKLTLCDILDFLDERFDRTNGRTSGKKLWILSGRQIAPVESIEILGGKIVMGTSAWNTILPEKRPNNLPGVSSYILELKENDSLDKPETCD